MFEPLVETKRSTAWELNPMLITLTANIACQFCGLISFSPQRYASPDSEPAAGEEYGGGGGWALDAVGSGTMAIDKPSILQ